MRVQHFREFSEPGAFDAVASIEMGEHVGAEAYPVYTRALHTAYVREFERQRAELEAAGQQSRDIWMALEMLNTGRLRLASKGIEHDGSTIDEAA